MKRDIRIIGKERSVLDVGKFVLALVAMAEQHKKGAQLEFALGVPPGAPKHHTPPPVEPSPPASPHRDQLSLPLGDEADG